MLIAHVLFRVQPTEIEAALRALQAGIQQIRAMPGCLAFIPFMDTTEPGTIGLLHEWQTPEAFTAYKSSDGFAEATQFLRPMMIEAPTSKRFDARLIKTLD